MKFETGYTGDGFTEQSEEDFAEQQACERAVEGVNKKRVYRIVTYDITDSHCEVCSHDNPPIVDIIEAETEMDLQAGQNVFHLIEELRKDILRESESAS